MTPIVALGDIALEQGEHGEARSWWEKLIPTPPQSISREPFERALANEQLPAEHRQELEKWYIAENRLRPMRLATQATSLWTTRRGGRWSNSGTPAAA